MSDAYKVSPELIKNAMKSECEDEITGLMALFKETPEGKQSWFITNKIRPIFDNLSELTKKKIQNNLARIMKVPVKDIRKELPIKKSGTLVDNNRDLWAKDLDRDEDGKIKQIPKNVMIIMQNDSYLKDKIKYNELSNSLYRCDNVYWREEKPGTWDNKDDSGLKAHLNDNYGISNERSIDHAVNKILMLNKFHPIRDYLDSLKWDYVPRIDTLLIDYFGAEDNQYTRTTIRKMLIAAVKRIYEPGCKMDYCLILVGKQGRGKSTFLHILGGDYYTDSVRITSDSQKVYESIKGFWILELGELAALRRAEIEDVKLVISRQSDHVRMPYDKLPEDHKRICIFFGSTNSSEFLMDATGNRRFWPVEIGDNPVKSIWNDLPKERNQIWAEAVIMYHSGEELYLPPEIESLAKIEQEGHEVNVPWSAKIDEYLDTLLPIGWEKMQLYKRVNFIKDGYVDCGEFIKGTEKRLKVCIDEIWEECLEGNAKDLSPGKAALIKNVMTKNSKWERSKSPLNFKGYGKHRGWIRKTSEAQ